MSTSEPKAWPELANVIDPSGSLAAAAAGVIDPALLQRMANEMFGAYGSAASSGSGGGASLASMPGAGLEPIGGSAGAISGVGGAISPTIAAMESMASPDTSPAAGAPAAESLNRTFAPGFGFLGDARSIEQLSNDAMKAAVVPQSTIPASTSSMPSATMPTASVPAQPQAIASGAGAPAMPGLQAIPTPVGASSVAGSQNTPGALGIGGMPDPIGTNAAALSMPGLSQAASQPMPSGTSLPGAPASAETSSKPPTSTETAVAPGFGFLGDVRSLDAMARTAFDKSVPGASTPSALSESQARTAVAMSPAIPGMQAVPAPAAAAHLGGLQNVPGMPALGGLVDPMSLAGLGGGPTSATAASTTGASLPFGISLADFGAPQVSGASVPAGDVSKSTFGFFDITRPLDPAAYSTMGGSSRPPAMPGAPMSGSSLPAAPSSGANPASAGGGRPLHAADVSSIPFDALAVRRDFPILAERINGRPLVWLDNAATTQKPRQVIERLKYYYEHENSNVHRAAHTLAARSTDAYEAAREKVRRFLNASTAREIIFVRGTTEGINLVAQSWGKRNIGKGDEIVITHLEHHANIVPWQMLCAETGAKLRVAPVDDSGQIILEEYERLLNPRTKLAAFAHVSNALGTITPVKKMTEMAHRHGAKVLVDAAQSVAHARVDVQEYDCDFLVFSGHKIFAPTGIGVVFGKLDILENTPPWQGGGNMIADVTFEKTLYHGAPVRFEAGTGSIADAVGLGAALDYLERIGMPNIERYEHDLLVYGMDALRKIPGLRLIGTAAEKASVMSFVLDGYRTEDVGQHLAKEGIAVRSGHHCAQPILRRFGVEATVRPSLAFYNTCEDIDALVAALWNLKGGRLPSVV